MAKVLATMDDFFTAVFAVELAINLYAHWMWEFVTGTSPPLLLPCNLPSSPPLPPRFPSPASDAMCLSLFLDVTGLSRMLLVLVYCAGACAAAGEAREGDADAVAALTVVAARCSGGRMRTETDRFVTACNVSAIVNFCAERCTDGWCLFDFFGMSGEMGM